MRESHKDGFTATALSETDNYRCTLAHSPIRVHYVQFGKLGDQLNILPCCCCCWRIEVLQWRPPSGMYQ